MDIIFKTCPECGKKSIQPIQDDYLEEDGVVIPSLEYFQCASCKAVFFDDAAMRRIEALRGISKRISSRKVHAIPSSRVKPA